MNDLKITDYSVSLLIDSNYDSLFRFDFTVTGDSLIQTVPPGRHSWMLSDTIYLTIYRGELVFDGNSYTLAYGDMRIAVFQTTTGWNTLLYEVRVFIRPGYTCTDEYCFNQLRNDAERQIQEVQEEILYAGQEALRDAQREYKAYDKNYKIEVRIVETKIER